MSGQGLLARKYIEEDLQRVTKLCMDFFIQAQTSHPGQVPQERPLNARFPGLYYALFFPEEPDLI